MNSKKLVLFFTYHFPYPEKPGSFRPWVEANILRDIGYDVTVITSGVDYITGKSEIGRRLFRVEHRDGIKIVKVRSLAHYRNFPLTRIINYLVYSIMAFFAGLFERKPDKIFIGTTSYFITFFSYLYKILKARDVKIIVDERDLFLEASVSLGVLKKGIIYSLLSRWNNLFRKNAESIFTVSEGMGKALVEKGVPSSKIEVIPNIDVELMAKDIERYYSQPVHFFDGKRDFIVIYAGSFGMANDVATILKAAELLDNTHSNIGFVLVGGGERLNFYKDYIKRKKIQNTIIFPALARNKVRNFLYHADVCIHALKKDRFWNMALSSKIFDYLLFKKPVIFCGGGEIKNIIEKADAGLCVEPQNAGALADAILKLYSQRDRLSEMGERGHLFVKNRYPIEGIYNSFKTRFNSYDP